MWYTRGHTLEDEVASLRAENAQLRALIAQLQDQLAAALARIAELEQQHQDPPPFVKPNRPPRPDPTPPRKKRAARHNQARRRETPTWRENGQNGYVWSFSTPGEDAVRYYEYDPSRAQAVVKRLMGGQFSGHL